MKKKIIIFVGCLLSLSIGFALASVIINSNISWTSLGPVPTSTFTVSATVNGTAASYNDIQLGTPYDGYTYVIVYTLTSTANRAITVAASDTTSGATATWNATQVSLPSNGDKGALQLTLTINGNGSGPVKFTSNP